MGSRAPRKERRAIMEAPYTVIADDLTGAGDTGVQFAHAGLRTRALLGEWDAAAVGGVDVVVLNTESPRPGPCGGVPGGGAGRRAPAGGGGRAHLQEDRLHHAGNVGAEVEAVMDVFGLKLAVICPAFPANRRLVAGGYLLVDGQPVARTAIGRDPVAPVKMSSIPALLAAQCRRPVRHVGPGHPGPGPGGPPAGARATGRGGPGGGGRRQRGGPGRDGGGPL